MKGVYGTAGDSWGRGNDRHYNPDDRHENGIADMMSGDGKAWDKSLDFWVVINVYPASKDEVEDVTTGLLDFVDISQIHKIYVGLDDDCKGESVHLSIGFQEGVEKQLLNVCKFLARNNLKNHIIIKK